MKKINYLVVGTFDISKYNSYLKTITNEVILTSERLIHIMTEHPEVIKNLYALKNVLDNPDMVFIQNDKKDTIWIIKKIDSNLKITIKLNIINYGDNVHKNSIIQMQYMHDKEIARNIISKKVEIIYKKDIDNTVNV